jgi:hypothetical protein
MFSVVSVLAQNNDVLTNNDVVQLVKAGLPEDVVVKSIETSASNLDTRANALVSLKEAGVPISVIKAMMNRKSTSSPSTETTVSSKIGVALPSGEGLYLVVDGNLKQLSAENVKTGSTSAFKMMATGGFGSMKVNGKIKGSESPVQISEGNATLILHSSDGMKGISGVQLIPLDKKGNGREFTMGKASVFSGVTSGADGQILKFEKIDSETFTVALTGLQRGEYLIYGILESRGAGSLGTMFTFGVR